MRRARNALAEVMIPDYFAATNESDLKVWIASQPVAVDVVAPREKPELCIELECGTDFSEPVYVSLCVVVDERDHIRGGGCYTNLNRMGDAWAVHKDYMCPSALRNVLSRDIVPLRNDYELLRTLFHGRKNLEAPSQSVGAPGAGDSDGRRDGRWKGFGHSPKASRRLIMKIFSGGQMWTALAACVACSYRS
nr:hypothetical protein [Frigoribacterium sp. Leaf164]